MADKAAGDADMRSLERKAEKFRSKQRSPDALSLRFLAGPCQGMTFTKPGVILTVGRTKVNSIWIKDPAVSESHAQLKWTGTAWELTDVGSTNGTEVNGQRMTEGESIILKEGDSILFGETSVCTVEAHMKLQPTATVLEALLSELTGTADHLQALTEQSRMQETWDLHKRELSELAGLM